MTLVKGLSSETGAGVGGLDAARYKFVHVALMKN